MRCRTSRRMCCPSRCASYFAPCQPILRAFSGWIRSPPPTATCSVGVEFGVCGLWFGRWWSGLGFGPEFGFWASGSGLEFRDSGFGFRGSAFQVSVTGCGFQLSKFRVSGSWFRVQGFGFRVWGLGAVRSGDRQDAPPARGPWFRSVGIRDWGVLN